MERTVAAELALILEVQTEEFWQDVALHMLENVRRRLRKLVKPIESGERKISTPISRTKSAPARILNCRRSPRH